MGRAVRARPGLPAPAWERGDGGGSRRTGRRRLTGAAAGARGGTAAPGARRRAAGPAAGRPDAALLAPRLDEQSFDVLLDAIGQALTGGTVGYSDDGTLQLTVFDMGEDRPIAAIRVGDGGVLESPDLLVQVGRVTA